MHSFCLCRQTKWNIDDGKLGAPGVRETQIFKEDELKNAQMSSFQKKGLDLPLNLYFETMFVFLSIY